MSKPICSNKTFEGMAKSFKKYANKQMEKNSYYVVKYFRAGEWFDDSAFDYQVNKLIKRFKSNPYKTKSGYRVEYNEVRFWVSYTVEDNGIRYFGRDFRNKVLAFKVHMQIGNHRKKRIACWKVQLQEKSIKI